MVRINEHVYMDYFTLFRSEEFALKLVKLFRNHSVYTYMPFFFFSYFGVRKLSLKFVKLYIYI